MGKRTQQLLFNKLIALNKVKRLKVFLILFFQSDPNDKLWDTICKGYTQLDYNYCRFNLICT